MADLYQETRPIIWLESFKMNIDEVDIEHRHLFDSLNELVTLSQQLEEAVQLDMLLFHAITSHKLHFIHEEALMARKNFPGLDAHALEHRRLEIETDQLYAEFLSLSPEAPDRRGAAVLKIRNALLDHFLHYDLAYKSHMLNAKGL
ncbi:bacteriohemerythrin [Tepidicaulis sp. LMO-SS28]|uniref:bacteriohemerythrin n=1 Tax=Tepidicaulis sp. LMO-SS28 TaxID=3447455 RepID=UPI003EDE9491